MRVLGLIPARGGSKGVPRKNVRLLGGKPLLQYAVEVGLLARGITRLVVSTEDPEIAAAARHAGAEVPFARPLELAQDHTPMLPVVQHALCTLQGQGDRFDAVCLLQPTSPFRESADIEGCLALLIQSGADSVVTVLQVPDEYNPHWVYMADASGALRLSTGETSPITRRQELPPAYHRDGSVYLTRAAVVEQGSLYGARMLGYPVRRDRVVNIDSMQDWERAERLLGAEVD
jgi:CMP-N,N'-diacetyllegionaminic acid synthase